MIDTNKIQAAFFDIDGTLLSFASHSIPATATEAVKHLRENGIKIFLATGRSVSNIGEAALLPYDGVIAMNGTDITLKDGMRISHHAIPENVFLRLLNRAEQYDVALAVEGDSGVFVNQMTERVKEISRLVDVPVPPVRELRDIFIPEVTSQLCLFADTATEKKIMSDFPGLTATRWCDIFADINVAGIDKGTGVKEICDYYGIDLACTIAFGDGGNDIPMIKTAGIGVAMGGAAESVKIHADYIAKTVDDDGIQSALKELGII